MIEMLYQTPLNSKDQNCQDYKFVNQFIKVKSLKLWARGGKTGCTPAHAISNPSENSAHGCHVTILSKLKSKIQ